MEQARRKQLVQVIVSHEIDGSVEIRQIILADGRTFDVERTRDVYGEQRPTGRPRRYPVTIRGQATTVYEDGGKFWVLMKS